MIEIEKILFKNNFLSFFLQSFLLVTLESNGKYQKQKKMNKYFSLVTLIKKMLSIVQIVFVFMNSDSQI